jgi:TolA-binding protein
VDTVVAAKYSVRYYPTICLLRSDGTEIERLVGYKPAPEYIAEVEDYLAGRNTLASLLEQEASKADSAGFIYRLGERLGFHGRFDDARERYLKVVSLDPENGTGLVDDALYYLSRMSRKDQDFVKGRQYAQTIVDRYASSDMYRPAWLQVGINLKRDGSLPQARKVFLDYEKKFPDDEDAPWAREQADTIAAQLRRPPGS